MPFLCRWGVSVFANATRYEFWTARSRILDGYRASSVVVIGFRTALGIFDGEATQTGR
jgi:hypothetical protein